MSPVQSSPPDAAAIPVGLVLGVIAVIIFGVTMPMTRLAVIELGPLFVTAGRALEAAACAAALLIATRSPLPPRDTWPLFAGFAATVVLGFPLGMALAMQHAPASHGGVILAVQPLLTVLASMVVAGERPSAAFFGCSLAGAATVMTYALLSSAGSTSLHSSLHWADLLLAGAAVSGSLGYAIGGQLSKRLPGWLVISWAVVLAAPFMLLWLFIGDMKINWQASPAAWTGFVYTGVFSMFLGFFAWNRALAIGGIARIGQLQLLQPFVTLVGAALLLGEAIGWLDVVFCALVVAIVGIGTRLKVRQASQERRAA